VRYTNKKLLQRVFAFSLAVAFLWQSAACAGGLPYSSLRTQPLVERHAGLIRLQQVRDGLAGLYSYSFDAARVWGVMCATSCTVWRIELQSVPKSELKAVPSLDSVCSIWISSKKIFFDKKHLS